LTEEEPTYNIADLLALLQHTDHRVVELAMLSALLVFKDVIPGYRIRPPSESELNVQLKKETKRMRDFEQCLLASYQKYLKFLDSKVTSGLKNPRKEVSEWDLIAKLGLSALRCFCELLRAVPHFNYRTMLLTAVVTRAAQPSEQVYSLCCETLIHVFKSDVEAEVSYETVKLISKILAVAKYDVPEALLRCLETVKLRVHADEAKTIRRKAKSERRKRRRDENEAELLESNPVADKSTSMRFQADSLHEICLIYFRYGMRACMYVVY
jgi:nucleolar complex protein 3